MKKGFALTELIMTIVIASLVLYTLLSTFITAAGKNANLESSSMAMSLAAGRLEMISSRQFSLISSEARASCGGRFSDFYCQTEVHYVSSEALTTSVDPLVTNYKWIAVRVSSALTPNASVEIDTLVTNATNK